jgi:uncharacterized protein YqhQ
MNKILLGGIVSVVASLIIAATAWNFSAVASVPDKYETKEKHQSDIDKIDRKLDLIIRHLIGGKNG